MKYLTVIVLVFFMYVGCNQPYKPNPNTNDLDFVQLEQRPKNIIIMIGDGMGLTQITAGMYQNGNKLNLEQ